MAKIRMERTQYSLITDGVREDEQTLPTIRPFWVFFSGNVGIGTWLMGVLVAGMKLNFTDAMFSIVLGSMLGAALVAVMSLLGPKTRLSQMEVGRFALGRDGNRLPAFMNWVGAIGWDVINNVLSAAALVSLLSIGGIVAPFWLALAILIALQILVGIYGHHLIQDTSKFTAILLGVFFIVIGIVAMHKLTGVALPEEAASVKDVFSAFTLMVAYNIGFVPYAADYTRYLPKKTPTRAVFLPVFMAVFLSLAILAFFGYMTAATVVEQTPEGVMKTLQNLTGHFAPLVLLLVAFNSIPVNAINDNSAAYSLMSAGFKFSRPTSAVFGAIIGYVICLSATSSFVEFFENFLFLFAHGITPWAAILLVHWFMVGNKERKTPSGITTGCVVFVLTTAVSIFLFSANSLYTGLLSDAVGGVDIGPYIGFVTAGLVYYAVLRLKKSTR